MKNPRPHLSLLLWAAVLPLWALAPLPAQGGETNRLEELENMAPEAKEKFLAKKVKEVNGFYQTQVGRYVVNSAFGAESAYYWGAVLDEFTDEALDEGVFPKKVKKMTRNPPTVYLVKDQKAYADILAEWGINAPGWSGGLFTYSPKAKAPMLFAWKFSPSEAEMRGTILHEATHQLMYYHVNRAGVPTWMNEGFATNLETYDTARRIRANMYYAMFMSNHANFLTSIRPSEVVPFSKLVNVSNAAWNEATGEKANINYASAWLAVNFFFTTKEGRKTMGKMLSSYAGNGKMPNLPTDKIDGLIDAHLQKTVLPCLKYGRLVFFLLENRQPDARRALTIAAKTYKDPEEEKTLHGWAREMNQASDDAKKQAALAGKIQEKMLAEFPDSPEAKLYGAWLDLVRDGDDAAKAGQAAETVNKLLKDNPDFYHPALNYVLAKAYFHAGQLAKAKEFLPKAIRDNRKHAATLELQSAIKEKDAGAKQ